MIRRPIESKNTGPYRKLFIESMGETIVNGTELNRVTILKLIADIDKKLNGEEKEEFLKNAAISEVECLKCVRFLRICADFIDTPLPPNTLKETISIDRGVNPHVETPKTEIQIKPIERVLRYENFNFRLIVKSEKYKTVYEKISTLPAENTEVKTAIIRDYVQNDTNSSIVIYDKDVFNVGDYISIREPYVVCSICDSIESSMSKNEFHKIEPNVGELNSILKNGWSFAQYQNAGAQNFFNTLIDKFLHELRVDEIRNTYWCSYCGSLVFTRLFSKINSNTVEIGVTVFANEEIPDKILIDFPQSFVMYMSTPIADPGSFSIYNDGVLEYKLSQDNISKLKSLDPMVNIAFNLSTKRMEITLDKKRLEGKINNTKNTTFFISLSKDVLLNEQLNSIEEYENIKSQFIFKTYKETYSGTIMRNDTLSPPVKWEPKRVRFSDLKNYRLGRVGIDLMLFYTFKE